MVHESCSELCERLINPLSTTCIRYDQAGTPELKIEEEQFDPLKHIYYITLSQSCPSTPGQPSESKNPFHIPISVGLLDSNGKEISCPTTGDVRNFHTNCGTKFGRERRKNDDIFHSFQLTNPFFQLTQTLKTTHVLELTTGIDTFSFASVPEKPVVSLLRNFSAPVKLQTRFVPLLIRRSRR